MAGNVWQWTEDCYDNSYAGIPADGRSNEAPSSDPKALSNRPSENRRDAPTTKFVGESFVFKSSVAKEGLPKGNPAGFGRRRSRVRISAPRPLPALSNQSPLTI